MENLMIQEQAKILRREGVIVDRIDKEDERGYRSAFFIEWGEWEWFVRMRNGEVTRVKKLWKIEE